MVPTSTQDCSSLLSQNCPKTRNVDLLGVIASSESRCPKLLKTLKTDDAGWSRWNGRFYAQGRCATRLRYAPTAKHFDCTPGSQNTSCVPQSVEMRRIGESAAQPASAPDRLPDLMKPALPEIEATTATL